MAHVMDHISLLSETVRELCVYFGALLWEGTSTSGLYLSFPAYILSASFMLFCLCVSSKTTLIILWETNGRQGCYY